jgi:hypothetical protein
MGVFRPGRCGACGGCSGVADLVLAHSLQPQLGDQPVDFAGRHPVDVGLLDDRDQGLLGAPARLQKRGEVAALAQLGHGHYDRTPIGL